MSASNPTIRWIEDLADQETLIGSGQRTSIDIGKTKDQVLSMETAVFVRDLFFHFDYLVKLFNGRVQQSSRAIRLSKIGDRQEGFQLTRNGISLVLDTSSSGVIQFRCEKNATESPAGFGAGRKSILFSGVVEAQFGAFDDLNWQFLGNPIHAEQLARHYLTEFIQIRQ